MFIGGRGVFGACKGDSTFCYPENIAPEMTRVFAELRGQACLRNLSSTAFAAGAAHFLAELNAIHSFRDGNGRSQVAFLALVAARAGHPLELERLDPPAFLKAMIVSFYGNEAQLVAQLRVLI